MKTKKYVTGREVEEIADEPQPTFESLPPEARAALLRLAAYVLDRTIPETVENLRLAHQLATWANELDTGADDGTLCTCGKKRRKCVCDQRAAKHYLATGDGSRLIGLGWSHNVLMALDEGSISPKELGDGWWQNVLSKRDTPILIRCQSLA